MCSSAVTIWESCALLVFLFVSFTVSVKKKVEGERKGRAGHAVTRFLEIDAMQLFWVMQTCVCCMTHCQCGWYFFHSPLKATQKQSALSRRAVEPQRMTQNLQPRTKKTSTCTFSQNEEMFQYRWLICLFVCYFLSWTFTVSTFFWQV